MKHREPCGICPWWTALFDRHLADLREAREAKDLAQEARLNAIHPQYTAAYVDHLSEAHPLSRKVL